MSSTYVVQEGDGIDSIAFQYGFFPDTLWSHPLNEKLKALRIDGNVLLPGDRVHIPDPEQRTERGVTSRRHIMKRKGVPSKFRLQLFHNQAPRANQPWALDVEGKTYNGETDGNGVFEIYIDPRARRGKLVIGPDQCVVSLQFGGLDPHDASSGYEQRLRNLDVLRTDLRTAVEWNLEDALRAFQFMMDLDLTGQPDDATLTALQTMQDCSALLPRNPAEEPGDAHA